MRQHHPYTATANRSRTQSESSIYNLEDAPAPTGDIMSPTQHPFVPPPQPPPPPASHLQHPTAAPPSPASLSRSHRPLMPDLNSAATAAAAGGGGAPSTPTGSSSIGRTSLVGGGGGGGGNVVRPASFSGIIRGRFNTWDGGAAAAAVEEEGLVDTERRSSGEGRPSAHQRQFQQQERQQQYNQQQPSSSSFGTANSDSARDAAIAAAWLSGGSNSGSVGAGIGGGSGSGSGSGTSSGSAHPLLLPSYRKSGSDPMPVLGGEYADQHAEKNDGGGGGAASQQDNAKALLAHVPSTIDEEREEGLSHDESGSVHTAELGETRGPAAGAATSAGAGADAAAASAAMGRSDTRFVRWLSSEASEISLVSDTVEDDDYYYNEDDDDDDDDGTATGDGPPPVRQSRSWQRSSAPGVRTRSSATSAARSGDKRTSSDRESAAASTASHPVTVCGVTLPCIRWPIRISSPSWNRVSSYIVRNAPCFWCGACGGRLEASATDRAVLVRLNVLCAVFALVQAGFGTFLFVVQAGGGGTAEEDELERKSLTPNLWSLNGMVFGLALVGIILTITMLLTLRVIREVNLIGAVRYMWALYWILPVEILLVISLFDYHNVTDVWIRHWWLTPSMAWFREKFCEPGTADTKCMVPVDGGADHDTEEEWCLHEYNATDCESIKNEAQKDMSTASYTFLTANAIWGLLLVALLLLALSMLESIITPPIVQSSKQANVPAWLTLPIVGCLAGGAALLFSPSSAVSNETGSEVFWIGVAYMASAGSFLVAALLGWFISAYSVLNSRDKQHKQIAVNIFIVTMILTIFFVAAIFAASLVFSVDLVDYGISEEERGRVACYVDTANSCTNCDESEESFDQDKPRCPEWTNDDILKVLQTQLKNSATLAAIFLIYAFSALRFGFVLRSHVSRYQIEYV